MFGEAALVNKAKRSADVSSKKDCQVLILFSSDYDQIIYDEKKL